jgi:hypothetical protein
MTMMRRHDTIAIGRHTQMMDTTTDHAIGITADAGRRGPMATAIIIGSSCVKQCANNGRENVVLQS